MKTSIPVAADLTPAGRRILNAASELFYRHGIAAVGVDLIAERSGVTKRTLYNSFGSKDVLVASYLLDRDQRWRRLIEEALAAPSPGQKERPLAPFFALREWTLESPRGCALINALSELPEADHPARVVAVEEKRWLLALFRRLVAEAGIADTDLGEQLFCLHEGALAVQGTLPDTPAVESALRAARNLVAATR